MCTYVYLSMYTYIHYVCVCVCVCIYIYNICIYVFACVCLYAAKLLQSCLTLCDPIDISPPGSAVPGILQARTLEWVAIFFSNEGKCKVKVKSLSHVRLFTTPWTAAYQAPLSMGFSRQEYWSGVPLPSLMFIWLSTNSPLSFASHMSSVKFLLAHNLSPNIFYYHPSALLSLISAAVTFFLMVLYVSILALIFSIIDIVIFCIKFP